MKGNYIKTDLVPVFIFFLIFVSETSAQFDSIIFVRNDIYRPDAVIFMGDQNDDGCDDFVLVTFESTSNWNAKALLFYGGNPISSVPVLQISFYGFIPYHISACDYNRDGYRDLIITSYNIKPIILNLYLGGPEMDTIPDFTFRAPENSVGSYRFIGGDWPVDFNGDGYEELIVRAYEMFDSKSAILIYNSSEQMDSIPDKIVTYYPDEAIDGFDITSGDLDGDGKTDLTFTLTSPSVPVNFVLRRFVFGRTDLSFQDAITILDSASFLRTNKIIEDINKDGRADVVFYDTKFKYPYWYIMAINYGSRNLDYIPEEGFNTQNEGFYHTRSVGDVNGDGYGDFLSSLDGGNGRLFVGGKHKIDDTPIRYYGSLFNILGRVGDVNGDGLDDIGIGANGRPFAWPGTFYIMSGERIAMAIEETQTGEEKTFLVTVSPNPTNGQISVQYTLPNSGVLRLEIYDILSQRIYNESLEKEKGTQTEQINLGNHAVSSGTYIVNLTLETGEKTLTKSIKVQLIK